MHTTTRPYARQEALFGESWLPRKPLCGEAKDGPKRHRKRIDALEYPYIEVNPLCMQSLVIIDVDSSDVQDLPLTVGLPRESWAVRTRNEIGTGHIGYALTNPVTLTDAARRRPINLLARIETGLRDVLGGDIAYSGRFMKNPVNPGPAQDTLWLDDPELDPFPTYGLKDLAAALAALKALPAWNDPTPRKNSGVGRNVDIFNRTRTWGYRAVRSYWDEPATVWDEVVLARATILNLELEREAREPLPEREIFHLSRSISKWIWEKTTRDSFRRIQAHRGRKGGIASGKKRRAELLAKWSQI